MTYQEAKTLLEQHGNDWINHMDDNKIKVGDIFYTSWGYDQTNYDFIVVTSISKTGKTVICKRAVYNNVGYSHFCNEQKPTKQPYGKPFRMYVRNKYWSNDEPCLVGQYIFCGGEDAENKRYDSFSRVRQGETFYETDPQFGH